MSVRFLWLCLFLSLSSYGQQTKCEKFISSLPSDYIRDWVETYEDPIHGTGEKIKVFYYGKISTSGDTVAFFNGGPGGSSHSSFRIMEKELKNRNLKNQLSFIYIDQRGTGCSTHYPQGGDDATIKRLRFYGSTEIVYDSELIRKKILGNKPWKVFGQSYGAFIVHRYVALFPHSIDKAYAHANVISESPLNRMINRVLSQPRVFQLYLQKYPMDLSKFAALFQTLNQDFCIMDKFHVKQCGYEIIEGFISSLGFSDEWEGMHIVIGAIVNRGVINQSILKTFVDESLAVDPEESMGLGGTVIGYYDRNMAAFDSENCKKAFNLAQEMGVDPRLMILNECLGTVQFKRGSKFRERMIQVLENQNQHLNIDMFAAGLHQMAPMSFFLYSGEKDCFVPTAEFAYEVSKVGELINYVNFPTSGHEGFYSEQKIWNDLIK